MNPRPISRIIVPNRGEIAVRIARACREMGIESVLAHSESDDTSFTRRYFDATSSLGPGNAGETYLNVGRIIDAARRCGADALHPGYGFLSERAELSAACADAKIIFIGPKPASIEAMGSKSASRQLMKRLGVPIVPGYDGDEQSTAELTRRARSIGFPLLEMANRSVHGSVRLPEGELGTFENT